MISDLEHSVGFALFVRAGRGFVATVEARRFYQGVEGMFIGVDKLGELAKRSARLGAIRWRLGAFVAASHRDA